MYSVLADQPEWRSPSGATEDRNGFGLRPVEDDKSAEEDRARRLIPWRGLRDDRNFPPFLRQGQKGSWPWVPYTPIDTDVRGYSATGATA